MSTSCPFFSILIPTVGRPPLISQAITSVLQQSFQDFEIIVADCDPTKTTQTLLDSFHDRRLIWSQVPDLDPSLGWDYSFKKSTGRYVCWFDDDNSLLPTTLQQVYDLIVKHQYPDILTGSHGYYYGFNHPSPTLRNALGFFPYSLKETPIDPQIFLQALYDYTLGTPAVPYRFHPASTYVGRHVAEKVIDRIGFVVLPHMPVNHSIQPLLLAFSKTLVHIDTPLAIVGRLGSSLSQETQSNTATTKPKPQFRFELSPLSGPLWCNRIAESYWRAKQALPDELHHVRLNQDKFLLQYARELGPQLKNKKAVFNWWMELLQVHIKNRNWKLGMRTLKLLGRWMIVAGFDLCGLRELVSKGLKIIRKILPSIQVPASFKESLLILDGNSVQNITECASYLSEILKSDTLNQKPQ